MLEEQLCGVCWIPCTTACGKCKVAFFCGVEHQKLVYKLHKTQCGTGLGFLQQLRFTPFEERIMWEHEVEFRPRIDDKSFDTPAERRILKELQKEDPQTAIDRERKRFDARNRRDITKFTAIYKVRMHPYLSFDEKFIILNTPIKSTFTRISFIQYTLFTVPDSISNPFIQAFTMHVYLTALNNVPQDTINASGRRLQDLMEKYRNWGMFQDLPKLEVCYKDFLKNVELREEIRAGRVGELGVLARILLNKFKSGELEGR